MPRPKPFDKKTATTYTLVNRPQNDPLIHDSDASAQVFADISSSSRQHKKSKVKSRGDLEEEFGLSGLVRDNEGEAAEYGIYYDDSSYDYMQHMRELGGSTEATWIEAPLLQQRQKGKTKEALEDALRNASLEDDNRQGQLEDNLVESVPAARYLRYPSYEDQQDVPDSLAGFQPDMDPRLREVLTALDDEAYVDDDEDTFAELAGEGAEEIDQYEWEAEYFDGDEDGWETDDTTKPMKEYKSDTAGVSTHVLTNEATLNSASPNEDGDWLEDFAKNKVDAKVTSPLPKGQPKTQQRAAGLDAASEITCSSHFTGRKKRKGALTSSTGFSMTSSALARTEPLSVLDSRFERIAESYMGDAEDEGDFEDNASIASGLTTGTGLSRTSRASARSAFGGSQASEAPSLTPANFDSVMDEFLGGAGGGKGRLMKKAGKQERWGTTSGMQQLDEIRQGLGPARVKRQNRKAQPV